MTAKGLVLASLLRGVCVAKGGAIMNFAPSTTIDQILRDLKGAGIISSWSGVGGYREIVWTKGGRAKAKLLLSIEQL